MAARYRILTGARLKHVVMTGATNYAEVSALFQQYRDDPEFRPDLRILADLRGLSDAVAGLWEIRKLKHLYQQAYGEAVGAVDVVIVVNRGSAYRAARAFQLFMRDRKPLVIRITDRMAEAQRLLGLDDAVMAALYPGA